MEEGFDLENSESVSAVASHERARQEQNVNSAAQKKDQEILQASTPSNAKTPEVQAVSSTSGDVTTVRVASMYFPCSASTARESSYGSGDRSLKMDRLHSGSMTGAGNEGKRVEKPGVVRPDSTATSQLYDDRHDLERPDGDFCTDNRLAWNPFYGLPGQYPRNVAPVMYQTPMIPAGDSHWKQNQSGEFKHNYRFRTPLAKKVDDKSKKHVQDMGRTIRSIVRTIGTLETAFVTVRGCFYGVLCAVEYGTLGWQMVLDLPLVRMALDLLRWFWRYARFVGRNVPLIGVLALIFGRVCLPMIRKAVQDLRDCRLLVGKTSQSGTETTKKVKFTYLAKNAEELTVMAGEEVVILGDQSELDGTKSRYKMVRVKRVKILSGSPSSGLIPQSALVE